MKNTLIIDLVSTLIKKESGAILVAHRSSHLSHNTAVIKQSSLLENPMFVRKYQSHLIMQACCKTSYTDYQEGFKMILRMP